MGGLVDLEQLNGAQRKVFRHALLSAFVSEATLNVFLNDELSKPPVANFAGGQTLEEKVFNLIAAAQAEGWTEDLVLALQAQRPRNPLVRNLSDALRMIGGAAPASASTAGANLERFVRGSGFADLRPWAEKLSTIGQAICRVELQLDGKTGYGTGMLVAEDLVLTNYHVVEAFVPPNEKPASAISCRFDFANDAKGLNQGVVFALAADRPWLVAQSKYDAADLSGAGVPSPDHLDFALLRLAQPVAEQEVTEGVKRGRIAVSRTAGLPHATDPVFIVQHPRGKPIALSIGIVQLDVPADAVRMTYDADTEPGSSGSGVFDANLGLVALHHAGDPDSKMRARYNQGVPIGRIVARLEAEGVAPFWS